MAIEMLKTTIGGLPQGGLPVPRLPRRAAKVVQQGDCHVCLIDPSGSGVPSQPVDFVFVDTTGDNQPGRSRDSSLLLPCFSFSFCE